MSQRAPHPVGASALIAITFAVVGCNSIIGLSGKHFDDERCPEDSASCEAGSSNHGGEAGTGRAGRSNGGSQSGGSSGASVSGGPSESGSVGDSGGDGVGGQGESDAGASGSGGSGENGSLAGSGGITNAGGSSGGSLSESGGVAGQIEPPPGAILTSEQAGHYFGKVVVGVPSSVFVWTVRNTGTAPTGSLLLGPSPGASTELVASTDCSNLQPNGSCDIELRFVASGPGTRNTEYTLTGGNDTRIAFLASADAQYDTVPRTLTIQKVGAKATSGAVSSTFAGLDCPPGSTTCSAQVPLGTRVTLRARTANGSEAFFSGWSGGGCSGAFHDCTFELTQETSVSATFSEMKANLVFVSSSDVPATLGSAARYDDECNARASAAGINDTAGDAYVAFVSDTSSPAALRLLAARGWVLIDGKPFANTLTTLLNEQQVYNAVQLDENGADPDLSAVFTGTDFKFGRSDTCSDWKSTSGKATAGYTYAGPVEWTSSITVDCSERHRILCMGKKKTVSVGPDVTVGRRIWVTNSGYRIGSPDTPDQRCQTDRPDGVENAVALLAFTDRPAAEALEASANYVRPDGTFVGTGALLSTMNSVLESGIWQSGDGAYSRNLTVWAGTADPLLHATPEDNCVDWSTPSSAFAKIGILADIKYWWSGYGDACNAGAKAPALYCVETAP